MQSAIFHLLYRQGSFQGYYGWIARSFSTITIEWQQSLLIVGGQLSEDFVASGTEFS